MRKIHTISAIEASTVSCWCNTMHHPCMYVVWQTKEVLNFGISGGLNELLEVIFSNVIPLGRLV